MIDPSTGEISFSDGFRITAHSALIRLLDAIPEKEVSATPLAAVGWTQHLLGEHLADSGTFSVEAVIGPEGRVEGVLLSHFHSFYDQTTPNDAERRVFHEGLIGRDLLGQREFSWGRIFCRVDAKANRDWLVIIYSPFAGVPLQEHEAYRVLSAREFNGK